MSAMYHIGKITNTHGIRGEVKIYNLSDFDRFLVNKEMYVNYRGEKKYFVIERVRNQKNILIVKFKGYDNINDILMYKGLDLYSDDDASDELDEDTYHFDMLIGKDVYTDQDVYVGKVTTLIPVPQGHLLDILKTDGKKALVPFLNVFVLDVLEDKIIIKPIEGLL